MRLHEGDAILLDAALPYRVAAARSFSHVGLVFPRHALPASVSTADSALGKPIAGDTGAVSMLVPLVQNLLLAGMSLSGPAAERIGASILDLVAVIIEDHAAGQVSAASAPPHLPRLVRFIGDRLGDALFDEQIVSHAYGLSLDQLDGLFTPRYAGLAGYIERRRLDSAYRSIIDPAQDGATLAEIADLWGFADLPTFCERFEYVFGIHPAHRRAVARWSRALP